RAGRLAGQPVAALLSEQPAQRVAVNAVLTAPDRAGLAGQAAGAVRDGFRCLKVKVGLGDDAGRIAAARAAAGPDAALRVDASGADPYVASTLDGPLGIAAGLHAAAALAAAGPLPHCGLATLGLFAGIDDPLPPRAGAVELPSSPGLGVEPF